MRGHGKAVRTGKPLQHANLTNKIFACRSCLGALVEPVFLTMGTDTTTLYLPCFSTLTELETIMYQLDIDYDKIKQINDTKSFLQDVPSQLEGRPVNIIIDVKLFPGGKCVFKQILRD